MSKAFTIDIETLAASKGGITGPVHANAKIIQIGVTVFDPNKIQSYDQLKQDTLCVNIDRYQQGDRIETADTLKWWENQNREVFESTKDNAMPMEDALRIVLSFLKEHGANTRSEAWAQGPTFDFTILQHAFDQYGMNLPFAFWNINDSRCYCNKVIGKDKAKSFVQGFAHNAGEDAIYQTMAVQYTNDIVRKIRQEM